MCLLSFFFFLSNTTDCTAQTFMYSEPEQCVFGVEGPDISYMIPVDAANIAVCTDAVLEICVRGDFGGVEETVTVFDAENGVVLSVIPGGQNPDCADVSSCTTVIIPACDFNVLTDDGVVNLELQTPGGTPGNQGDEVDAVCDDTFGTCFTLTSLTYDSTPLPTVIMPATQQFCITDAPITLTVMPPPCASEQGEFSGTFSGPGITDNGDNTASFDPAAAGDNCPDGHVVTFTPTPDAEQNSCLTMATATFIVDGTPPEIICADNVAGLTCGDPLVETPPTVTDVCNMEGLVVIFADNLGVDEIDPCVGGVITRTYTVTDACMLEATCMQTFTFDPDTEPPVITCPDDVTGLICGDALPAPEATLGGTDNCDEATTFTVISTIDDPLPTTFCDGNNLVVTRTYTVADACGNEATCVQSFTFDPDTEPPVITCPDDVTGLICGDALPAPEATLGGTDNCDEATTFAVISTIDDTLPTTFCDGDNLVFTRTYTVADACGNETTCVQSFTFESDLEAPELSEMPENVTLVCGDPIPEVPTITATDNCTEPQAVVFEETTVGTCPESTVIMRTWTATDDCGNETTYTQTIDIPADNVPPVLSEEPADENLTCADAIPDVPTVTATDDCTDSIEVIFEETDDMGACPNPRIITRTWTATDACTNETTYTQTITIAPDETPPVIMCPPNDPTVYTLEADIPVAAADVTEFEELGGTAMDDCGAMTLTAADEVTPCPGAANQGMIVRTYTITDECGNFSTCEQTFLFSCCDAAAGALAPITDICIGESISTTVDGTEAPAPDYGYDYVLTDAAGAIIDGPNTTGIFTPMAAGSYCVYGISYQTATGAPDYTSGNITTITQPAMCFDTTNTCFEVTDLPTVTIGECAAGPAPTNVYTGLEGTFPMDMLGTLPDIYVFCEPGCVEATGAEGTAPYTYEWFELSDECEYDFNAPITNTPDASGLDTGTYSVVVTDASGCTATGEVKVFVDTPPELTASDDATICAGETFDLEGTSLPGPGICLEYCEGELPVCLVDDNTIFTVCFVFEYPWISDLNLILQAPNGTQLTLVTSAAYPNSSDDGNMCFTNDANAGNGVLPGGALDALNWNTYPTGTTDAAGTGIGISGNWFPEGGQGAFGVFNGVDANSGTWQVIILDDLVGEEGFFNSFTLDIVNPDCSYGVEVDINMEIIDFVPTTIITEPIECEELANCTATYQWTGSDGFDSGVQTITPQTDILETFPLTNITPPVGTTTYTLTVTDCFDCISTEEVVIIVEDEITADAASPNCGELDITAITGGTPDYTITIGLNPDASDALATATITDATTTPEFTDLAAGDYFIAIEDANGCTVLVGPITVESCCEVAPGMLAPITDICIGQMITTVVDGTQNTDPDYAYEYVLTDTNGIIISGPQATGDFTPAPAGMYCVYGVNYNATDGAVDYTSGDINTITHPTDCADVTNTCFNVNTGPTVTIGECADGPPPTIVYEGLEGTYPDGQLDILPDVYVFCEPGCVEATGAEGTAPYTYEWFELSNECAYDFAAPIANTSDASDLGTGTYSVVVTDASGCTNTAEVKVFIDDMATLTASDDATLCASETFDLEGASLPGPGFCLEYCAGELPQCPIDASSTITVCMEFTHTYISDLSFELVAPDGTVIPLVMGQCCPNGANDGTMFCFTNDTAGGAVALDWNTTGAGGTDLLGTGAGISGTWLPEGGAGVLGGLAGVDANGGPWAMIVTDIIGGDSGQFESFNVTVTSPGGGCNTVFQSPVFGAAIPDDGQSFTYETPVEECVEQPNCTATYQWTGTDGFDSGIQTIATQTDQLETFPPLGVTPPVGTTTYTLTVTDCFGCVFTEEVVITVADEIVAEATSAACGELDITSITGGAADYTITIGLNPDASDALATAIITDATATPEFTDLAAGDYFISIEDANGCSVIIGPITIEECDECADFMATAASNACGELDITTITGGAPDYMVTVGMMPDASDAIATTTLTDAIAAPEFTDLAGGDYFIEIIDANNCSFIVGPITIEECELNCDDFMVDVAPCADLPPNEIYEDLEGLYPMDMLGILPDVYVFCEPGCVSGVAVGGTAPLMYEWFELSDQCGYDFNAPIASTQEASGLDSGVYTVVVTDANGCTGSQEVKVFVNTPPELTTSDDAEVCAGETFNLEGTSLPTAGFCLEYCEGELPVCLVDDNTIFTVCFVFEYPWISDLNLILQAPNGTQLTLVTSAAYPNSSDDGNMCFTNDANAGNGVLPGGALDALNWNTYPTGTTDAAGTGIGVSGNWFPEGGQGAFGVFNGVDANSGTWQVIILDDLVGEEGFFNSFTLDIVNPDCSYGVEVDINMDIIDFVPTTIITEPIECEDLENCTATYQWTGTDGFDSGVIPIANQQNMLETLPPVSVTGTTANVTYTLTVTDCFGCVSTETVLISACDVPTCTELTPIMETQDLCSGNAPDLATAEANILASVADATQITGVVNWYTDAAFTMPYITGTVIDHSGATCDPEMTTLFAEVVCNDGTTIPAGQIDITVYPFGPEIMAGTDCVVTITPPACPGFAIGTASNPTGGASLANWDATTNTYTGVLGDVAGTIDIEITGGTAPCEAGTITIDIPACTDPTDCENFMVDVGACTAGPAPTIVYEDLEGTYPDGQLGILPDVYVFCELGCVEAFPVGGTAPLIYEWFELSGECSYDFAAPIANTADASALGTGTYTVVVTDANGCTASQEVKVFIDEDPTLTTSEDAEICAGEVFNLESTALPGSGFCLEYCSGELPQCPIDASSVITVCLEFQHTYISDLSFDLIGPDGTVVNLITAVCCPIDTDTPNDIFNFCFINDTNAPILDWSNGVAPTAGSVWQPSGGAAALNGLIGLDANGGPWAMTVTDIVGGDSGQFESFNVTITSAGDGCNTVFQSPVFGAPIPDDQQAFTYETPVIECVDQPNCIATYQWTGTDGFDSGVIPITPQTDMLNTLPAVPVTIGVTATYTLTVTDCFGCVSTETITITECNDTGDTGFDLALIKTLSPGQTTVVAAGDNVSFDITVTNQGTVDAFGVLVNDYVPAGYTYNPALNPTWTDADGDGNPDQTITSLAAGSTQTITIILTVVTPFNGTMADLVNVAEISAADDDNDPNNTPPTDDDSTADNNPNNDAGGTPGGPDDDFVDGDGTGTPNDNTEGTDEDDQDPAFVIVDDGLADDCTTVAAVLESLTLCGGIAPDLSTIEATILSSVGDATLITNTVNWYFDNGLTTPYAIGGAINHSDTDAAGTCNPGTVTLYGEVVCLDGASINVGTITITVYPFAEITPPTAGSCTTVVAASSCPNLMIGAASNPTGGASLANWNAATNTYTGVLGDAAGTIDVAVTGGTAPCDAGTITIAIPACTDDNTGDTGFDLALIKTLSPGQTTVVAAGDNVSFDITVTNQGTVDAFGVLVNDYVPAGYTYNPALNPTWTDADGDGNPDQTITSLAAGSTQTITIILTVVTPFNGTMADLVNVAEISAADDDNDPNNTPPTDDDSTADNNPNNDAGGTPGGPDDDFVDGDGTGTPNDNTEGTDEDDQDPAFVIVDDGLADDCTTVAAVLESLTLCGGIAPDLSTIEATILSSVGDATLITNTVNWYFDNGLTTPYAIGGAINHSDTDAAGTCNPGTVTLYGEVVCLDGASINVGTITITVYPFAEITPPTAGSCTTVVAASSCPNLMIGAASNPTGGASLANWNAATNTYTGVLGDAAGTIDVAVTGGTAPCDAGTITVAIPACTNDGGGGDACTSTTEPTATLEVCGGLVPDLSSAESTILAGIGDVSLITGDVIWYTDTGLTMQYNGEAIDHDDSTAAGTCEAGIVTLYAQVICDDGERFFAGIVNITVYPFAPNLAPAGPGCMLVVTPACPGDIIGIASNATGGASLANWDPNTGVYTAFEGDFAGSIDLEITSANTPCGTMIYTLEIPRCGNPDEVPTVGEWGLIILGLMMSIVAIVGIRQRREDEYYAN